MKGNQDVTPKGARLPPTSRAEPVVSGKAGIPNADERLAQLLALEENWNSYNGRPVDRAVAERVRSFVPFADKLELSPWISPLSDGSLQIERAGTDDYTVEFNRDGTASVYFEGLSDKDALGFLSQFALVKALDRAAQGIEAGTATTEGRGPKDESPVA